MKSLRSSRFLKSERKLESTMQEVAFIREESKKALARNESCRENIAMNKIRTTENSLDREDWKLGRKATAPMRCLINDTSLKHYQDHLSSDTGHLYRNTGNSSRDIESPKAGIIESGTFKPYDEEI